MASNHGNLLYIHEQTISFNSVGSETPLSDVVYCVTVALTANMYQVLNGTVQIKNAFRSYVTHMKFWYWHLRLGWKSVESILCSRRFLTSRTPENVGSNVKKNNGDSARIRVGVSMNCLESFEYLYCQLSMF